MRAVATMMALLLCVPAVAAQTHDPRVPAAEAEADRIEAQRMYEQQRQRDQREADRVARTNLDRQADYDLYVAKQRADHEARMAAWRAQVAKQKADYEARVARCLAGDRTACAPR